jgi:hypothetical protein
MGLSLSDLIPSAGYWAVKPISTLSSTARPNETSMSKPAFTLPLPTNQAFFPAGRADVMINQPAVTNFKPQPAILINTVRAEINKK